MMNHLQAKDHWFSYLRMPYERVFSMRNQRVCYRGVSRNQFAAFMNAIGFYLKRILVLDSPGSDLLKGSIAYRFS